MLEETAHYLTNIFPKSSEDIMDIYFMAVYEIDSGYDRQFVEEQAVIDMEELVREDILKRQEN